MDKAAQEVAAMQFAGGLSLARVAELWQRDASWVEDAVRNALLATIPLRDGGSKLPRALERAGQQEARRAEEATRATQEKLRW